MRILLTTTRDHQHDTLEVVHKPILQPQLLNLPKLPKKFDAIAYSSWGLEALKPYRDRIRSLYVVGEKTAQLADEFESVDWPDQQDFEGVVQLIEDSPRDLPVISIELEDSQRSLHMRLPWVRSVPSYRTSPSPDWAVDLGEFDWVIVASPKAAEYLDRFQEWPRTASIGPTTTAAILSLGREIDFEPESPSISRIFEYLASLTD